MNLITLTMLVIGVSSSVFPTLAGAQTVQCVLTHSASADVKPDRQLDVHARTEDNLTATLVGLGSQTAYVTFDSDPSRSTLMLRKDNADAFFYEQDAYADGIIYWVYFKRSRTVTYAKLRAFPLTGAPSSYLMLGLCK